MSPFLDGLMLGDGSLSMHGKLSARLTIGRKLAHQAYNEWLMGKLPEYQWGPVWCHTSRSVLNGRVITGQQHRVRTRASRSLKVEYARWYCPDPATGKRVRKLPSDFQLTVESLAVVYMDDGSLSALIIRKGERWQLAAVVALYTCSFSRDDVERLAAQLRGTFDLKCSVQVNRGKPIIRLSGLPQVRRFIEIVRPIVAEVGVMAYKLNLEDRLAEKQAQIETERSQI